MAEVVVHVKVDIHPTESEDKVRTAVKNMFSNLSIQVKPDKVGSVLVAEGTSREALENFRAVLRRDRVRAAARKLLNANVRGNEVIFYLNKQVAFTGHISFSLESGESPLGPIKVVIESENPRELVDWLAPRLA
jgi:hypothetical protein